MAKPSLNLSYAATIPFSTGVSVALYVFYISVLAGLLAWNFISSAKGVQCTAYSSGEYHADQCDAASLQFGRSYYTRPTTSDVAAGTIGTFPWSPLAFGNGTAGASLDYTLLSANWTADPLTCVMYDQYLILDLSTEGSTSNACYYCNDILRVICTTIDSQRMQIPDVSAVNYVRVLDNFNQLSILAHDVATTAQAGATVGSVRIKRQRAIPSLPAGVIPVTEDSFSVILGSTIGSFPIFSNNSNAAVARVASYAETLSQIVEEATERDLQPGDASEPTRTLQASYLCRTCTKEYKPVLEIIALLLGNTFAVLTPLFTAAKLIAEWMSPSPSARCSASSNAGTPPASPAPQLYKPTSASMPSTPVYQPMQQPTYPTYPAAYHQVANPAMPTLPYQPGYRI